ncbi:MAG TPA: hypothetical protein VHZ95_15175 [Polyangiales bacterium]|nr:hypothetical protein [Polyangiales bacterium]
MNRHSSDPPSHDTIEQLHHDGGGAHSSRTEDELDALEERFFSQDSLRPVSFDDEGERSHMPHQSRTAMQVALAMLAVSAITIGALLIYMRLIMPVPVHLGGPSDNEVPEFEPAKTAASTAEPPPPSAAGADSTVKVQPPDDDAIGPSSALEPIGDAATALVSATNDANLDKAELRPTSAIAPARTTAPSTDSVLRAYGSLNRGDAAQALIFARRAVNETPRRADAWIALGSAYDALHDGAQAHEAFHSCLEQASGPYLEQCHALAHE